MFRRHPIFARFLLALYLYLPVFSATASGQVRATIQAHQAGRKPTVVCLSPDGSVAATSGVAAVGGDTMEMKLWDAASGKLLTDLKAIYYNHSTVGSFRSGAVRYSIERHTWTAKDVEECSCAAFSPEGMTLAWGNRSNVSAWNTRTGKLTKLWQGLPEFNAAGVPSGRTDSDNYYDLVLFSPDGSTIVSAGRERPYVLFWDHLTGLPKPMWRPVDSGGIRSVAFVPKHPWLAAVADAAHGVQVWDYAKGKLKARFGTPADDFYAVAISRDGKWLAAAGATIKVWDVVTRKELGTLEGHAGGIRAAAFFTRFGGPLVTTGQDGQLRLWDLSAWKEQASHAAHVGGNVGIFGGSKGVTSLAVTPDGKTLATAGWDGSVKIWNTELLFPGGGKHTRRK